MNLSQEKREDIFLCGGIAHIWPRLTHCWGF